MSDHFVDAAYQPQHKHDIMGGTPHIADEDNYRFGEHKGRHVVLSDDLFADTYPTYCNDESTLPKNRDPNAPTALDALMQGRS